MVEALYDTGAIDVQQRNHARMTAKMYALQSSGREDLVRRVVTDCGIDVCTPIISMDGRAYAMPLLNGVLKS